MDRKKIFISIAVYNEKENIKDLVEKIFFLGVENLNLVIIDDNSPDGTGEILDELAFKYPIIAIHRKGKLGYGSAHIVGFKKAIEAGASMVITMDADFSHHPMVILEMIRALEDGFEIVVGSRRIQGGKIIGWNWWREFCSAGAMQFSRLILGLKTKDVTSGFRAYQVRVIKQLSLDKITSNGYSFLEEILFLCEKQKFKIKEIPITFLDRKKGKSKLSSGEIINFFITILRLKINR
ncbi:MAG: dolichol-phosphate mannosyltransferase [Parcubacteria group bacterium Athens1014_10]|nr:MAG: dolichol-phosphate mannosyltransferase [Parcubacteria group bacterium Athens1014_10]TSD04476.1 MAG: dolichol-phosphate mannosyltransferase [Parcubacteria group bacterium Athens0714_12]